MTQPRRAWCSAQSWRRLSYWTGNGI